MADGGRGNAGAGWTMHNMLAAAGTASAKRPHDVLDVTASPSDDDSSPVATAGDRSPKRPRPQSPAARSAWLRQLLANRLRTGAARAGAGEQTASSTDQLWSLQQERSRLISAARETAADGDGVPAQAPPATAALSTQRRTGPTFVFTSTAAATPAAGSPDAGQAPLRPLPGPARGPRPTAPSSNAPQQPARPAAAATAASAQSPSASAARPAAAARPVASGAVLRQPPLAAAATPAAASRPAAAGAAPGQAPSAAAALPAAATRPAADSGAPNTDWRVHAAEAIARINRMGGALLAPAPRSAAAAPASRTTPSAAAPVAAPRPTAAAAAALASRPAPAAGAAAVTPRQAPSTAAAAAAPASQPRQASGPAAPAAASRPAPSLAAQQQVRVHQPTSQTTATAAATAATPAAAAPAGSNNGQPTAAGASGQQGKRVSALMRPTGGTAAVPPAQYVTAMPPLPMHPPPAMPGMYPLFGMPAMPYAHPGMPYPYPMPGFPPPTAYHPWPYPGVHIGPYGYPGAAPAAVAPGAMRHSYAPRDNAQPRSQRSNPGGQQTQAQKRAAAKAEAAAAKAAAAAAAAAAEAVEPPGEKVTVRCPICLSEPPTTATCAPCGHVFCQECIFKHLLKKKQCPLCRKQCTKKMCFAIYLEQSNPTSNPGNP